MIQHGFQVRYTFVSIKHSIFYAIIVIIKMQLASI